MRTFIPIALVTFVVVVLLASALPLFGFDPMGSVRASAYGASPITLLVIFLALMVMAVSVRLYTWRRNPARGFPWWDLSFYCLLLIIVIVVCVRYYDELGP